MSDAGPAADRVAWPKQVLRVLPWLAGLWLLAERALSDGIIETGDGVQHYMIARYAWAHPELLLDHWGKPLFTLLASPFAQLGHAGTALFNVLCVIVALFAGMRALRGTNPVFQALFVVVLTLSPQYVAMTLGGMTEILFGTVAISAVCLLCMNRPVAAAIVASFTPFARPEYVAFLPMVVLWLAWERKWKAVLLCGTGLVAYGLVGWVAFGDPFWFWTRNPYNAIGAYGSGDGWKFFQYAEEIFGRPLLNLGVASLILWALIYWKDVAQRRMHLLLLAVTAVPTLLAMSVHAWAWQHGTHGSAGLLRVIITMVPLSAVFTMHTLGRGLGLLFERRMQLGAWLGAPALIALGWWSLSDLHAQLQLPVRPTMEQGILDKAGDLVHQQLPEDRKLWTSHPYIPFRAGVDSFDEDRVGNFYGYNADQVRDVYRPGDLLFWDTQLGSSMEHCPLDEMLADTNLVVRSVIEPFERQRVLGGYIRENFLYERGRARRSFTTDTLSDQLRFPGTTRFRADTIPGKDGWHFGEGEFPMEAIGIPWPAGEHVLFDRWRFEVDLTMPDSADQRVVLVYAQSLNGRHLRYDQEELRPGMHSFWIRVPIGENIGSQQIYLWNISKKPFALRTFRITRERWRQEEITAN